MARSKDRLQHCKTQLGSLGLDFERIEAVDAKLLDQKTINQHYDASNNIKLYKKNLNTGEIACYLSHRLAWTKIIEQDLDFAVILEDDFIINDEFAELVNIMNMLKSWHYLRLANFGKKYKVDARAALDERFEILHFNQIPINTQAQAVSKEGAKRLLKNTEKFSRPIDIDLKHFWEKEIDLIGLSPCLVNTTSKFESDITTMDGATGREAASKFVRRTRYIINFKLRNFLNKRRRPKLQSYIS